MKPRPQSELEKIVKDFNDKYPVGSTVLWRSTTKSEDYQEMVVKREAYVTNGHSAVAFFENESGYCCIEPRFIKEGFFKTVEIRYSRMVQFHNIVKVDNEEDYKHLMNADGEVSISEISRVENIEGTNFARGIFDERFDTVIAYCDANNVYDASGEIEDVSVVNYKTQG